MSFSVPSVSPVLKILRFVDSRASCENRRVQLHINGDPRDCPAGLTLAGLLEHLGMKADRVAVERNRDIVPREQWSETRLDDGDQLEIVHFVGGG